MSQAFKTAAVRALISGVVLGGASGFGQLAAGSSYKVAIIAAGVAFFGTLILRGGGEGFIDNQAASAKP